MFGTQHNGMGWMLRWSNVIAAIGSDSDRNTLK